jgi:hypothetical protein
MDLPEMLGAPFHHEERRAIAARRDTSYREEAPVKPVKSLPLTPVDEDAATWFKN